MLKYLKWIFRGKPVKKVIGGWCGCCGKWVADTEFTFRDYWVVDNFWDLNTICSNCDCGLEKNKEEEHDRSTN